MIAGGAEASISELSIAGFSRMKALTKSRDPLFASRPFDANRDGFVLAEGAAVLILEDLSTALERNVSVVLYTIRFFLSTHVITNVCMYRHINICIYICVCMYLYIGSNCSRIGWLWCQ